MQKHLTDDRIVDDKAVTKLENKLNAHTNSWIEIFQIGDKIGQKSRTKSNLITEKNPIPILRGTAKDHKPCLDKNIGPDMRPIMGATIGPNTGLAQIGCSIIRGICDDVKVRYDVKSTEEMLSRFDEYNKSLKKNKRFKRKIIASMDIKNFYPSIDADKISEIVKIMWERSTLDVGDVDYEELAFYVGKYTPRELIVKSHLEEYTYTKKKRIYKKKKVARKFNRKLHIKIRKQKNSVDQDATMSPSQSHIPCMQNPETEFNKKVKKNKKSDWEKPKKIMTDIERKKLFGLALQTLILTCMKNHLYQFKGKVRLQKAGGPTGLDLTGELADLFMLWWDQEFLAILEKLSIDTDVYTRFKDDIDLVCDALPGGGKFIKEHCDIIFENETFNEILDNERKYLSLKEIYENKQKYQDGKFKVWNEIKIFIQICNRKTDC